MCLLKMNLQWLRYILLIIALMVLPTKQISIPDGSTYVAGVVEFMPTFKYFNDTSASEYCRIIYSEKAKDTDIIVFPEMTFNTEFTLTYIPDPKSQVVPCGNNSYEDFLASISCAAKITRKYIVINVNEKDNCTVASQESIGDTRPCAINGLNIYNTNVVFDRNGVVISRYRKWNLFGERNKNVTLNPEYGVFDTDFGVRFGHFICFDILFNTPSQELISRGITDMIFPTMWFSELPFLTAVQVQSSWSYANDVNLLAAGANNAAVGSTGTGIYAGKKGALISVMQTHEERELYVAVVPKHGAKGQIVSKRVENNTKPGYLFLKRDHIDLYNTSLVNTLEKSISQEICNNDICCNFYISTNPQQVSGNSSNYFYRFAAYSGVRTYSGVAKGALKLCAIMACTDKSIASCGTIFNNTVNVENDFIFESIQIKGNFKDSKAMVIMPNSLDSSYMPLPIDEFYFNVKKGVDNNNTVQYQLMKPRSDLLTFAIYGNVLNAANIATQEKVSTVLVSPISLVLIIFYNRS